MEGMGQIPNTFMFLGKLMLIPAGIALLAFILGFIPW